jgi:DNA invertase Pin-like site-specific DNA recombinase
MKRVALFVSNESRVHALTATVQDRGDIVGGVFESGRHGRGWSSLMRRLTEFDVLAVNSISDVPGRTAGDLLGLVHRLQGHGLSLLIAAEGVDTATCSAAMLVELTGAFRAAKLSIAIRHGQQRAKVQGKRIGRPKVPAKVRSAALAAIRAGGGVREVARRHGIAPASVINLRREMLLADDIYRQPGA